MADGGGYKKNVGLVGSMSLLITSITGPGNDRLSRHAHSSHFYRFGPDSIGLSARRLVCVSSKSQAIKSH